MAIYFGTNEITNIDNLVPQTGLDITDIWFGSTNIYTVWQTYEGTLPATLNANGDNMRQYQVWGNVVGAGEPTENLFEVESDMLSSLNWGSNPPLYSNYVFFINYKLSDAVAQKLKTGQHTCSIFRHFMDGYVPQSIVCAFTPALTSTVDENYRILTGNGITFNRTFNFFEWQDIYLIIGYSSTFSSEEVKQLKIDELFANWRISITNGFIPPETYIPYGYKLPMMVSNRTTSTTTPIYIGEPLGKDECVDYKAQKVYRMINGVLTPTDPPVPLPALPTCEGTTIVDYAGSGTAPEKVLLKYRKEGY